MHAGDGDCSLCFSDSPFQMMRGIPTVSVVTVQDEGRCRFHRETACTSTIIIPTVLSAAHATVNTDELFCNHAGRGQVPVSPRILCARA